VDQHRVVRPEAGTELQEVAHHAPRHRTRGFALDVIEAHLMKPAGGKERRDFGRAVATGSYGKVSIRLRPRRPITGTITRRFISTETSRL
jgi:hypothetical protein